MGYPLEIAVRYLGAKKRTFVSVGTAFAILGVALGVASLAIVMSVTGGFQEQFRDKVLGVNAHINVLKYILDFREYRDVMADIAKTKGVVGVAPFIITPTMVTHTHGGATRTATGVLLKGVDPGALERVLDLPKHIVEPSGPGAPPVSVTLAQLRRAGAKPAETPARDRDALWPYGGYAPDPPMPMHVDPPAAVAPLPASAPVGKVRPAGGYGSQLPSDDFVLPDSIDPDPCSDARGVSALPGVIIGRALGKQLGVGLGDCLQVTSPIVGMTFGSLAMRAPIAKQFRVIAMFEAGFEQYDAKLVYTDLYEAQALYDQGDTVTGLELKVDDVTRARAIAGVIDRALPSGLYRTIDWQELNHGLFTALLIQQLGMSLVLGLIIVVAAFTVVATLIMVVLDKKKEIAILKALGARDGAVLRIFLYQGAIIGCAGTASGLAVGYAGCKALVAYAFPLDPRVYFISKLPVNIRPTEFLITGGVALVICLVATIFPALYAAGLRPADGLRDE